MPGLHLLGDYLRARRELLRPSDVGLPPGLGPRRVPGLRRSELAAIAGISTEYYVKLEQGQETRPTDQVLDSLSRALKLDETANSYLHSLVRLANRPAHAVAAPVLERTRWLLDSWPMTAAMILDGHTDIIAVNPLMSALVESYQIGRNALSLLLLDSRLRALYLDWEGLSMRSIALFRSTAGLDPEHPRTRELVAELSSGSARFRELWHRHDIAGLTEGTHPMNHPAVGILTLHYAQFALPGADGHSIFLYYAEPGTSTASALAELAAGSQGGSGATSNDLGTLSTT